MKHRMILAALLFAVLFTVLLSACSFVPEEIRALEGTETAATAETADAAAETAVPESAKQVEALPGAPLWPWLLGEAVLLIALAAFVILRHKKKTQNS